MQYKTTPRNLSSNEAPGMDVVLPILTIAVLICIFIQLVYVSAQKKTFQMSSCGEVLTTSIRF